MVSRVADDAPKSNNPSDGSDTAARETDTTKSTEPIQTQSSKSEVSQSDAKTSEPAKAKTPETSSDSQTPATRRRKPTPAKTARAKSLKADVDRLEARLKRADEATQSSLASLQTVVSALEASLKTSTETQKGRLTQHVSDLTTRLDQQSTDMREAIRKELKSALSEGGLDYLDAAVGRASMRLDKAEIEQADAITKVNKHLADIARAVDARMKAESRNRKAELDTLTEKLTLAIATSQHDVEKRVTAVERDSAEALNRVGATIEQIHNRLEQRRQSSSEGVAEKINELALQTQAELDARLKEVEARHLAVGTGAAERVVERVSQDIDHKIEGLQRRVIELERGSGATPPMALAPLPPLPDTSTSSVTNLREPLADMVETDLPPNPIQTLKDRLTTFRTPAAAPTLVPAPARSADPSNPYAAALETQAPLTLDQPVPTPVVPQAAPPAQPFQVQPHGEATRPPPLPPFQMPTSLPPLPAAEDFQPAPLPEEVYSNPAYAENVNMRAGLMARSRVESPMAVRVASTSPLQRFSMPSLSSRNVRVALLATGVAVVALMAGRMILSTGDNPDSTLAQGGQPPVVTTTSPENSFPLNNGAQTPNTLDANIGTGAVAGPSTEPIGNYAETQPVIIDSAELDTLEAAVEAGNPIAQFQMGLAKLDAGETEDGASLIRQAASANQPAALYRLAKLYESGEGVPQDDVMARQLIERAARGGNRIAMHDLALFYTEGRGGVELDMNAAKSWFEQAARRGVVDSQFNLAVLSESSEIGSIPNPEQALFWYSIAASQGDQFAVSRRDALRASLDADRLTAIDDRIQAFTPRPIDEAANGIFSNVPWVTSASSSSNNRVLEAQTLLASMGYSVGTPDGVMGSRTRTAIVEFERANGLSETGQVSRELVSRLAQASGS